MTTLVFDLDQTLFDRQRAFDDWITSSVLRRLDANGYGDRERFFAAFASLTGQTLDQPTFTEAITRFAAPDEKLLAILKRLQSFYQLAILTNGGVTTQLMKITVLGLDRIFPPERIFISSRIGLAKPDRVAFGFVAQQLGAMPHECCYFGDQMETDIIAARSAGWTACHVLGPEDLQNNLLRWCEVPAC